MALFSVRADTPWEFLLRFLALLLVIGGVVLAFWKHSERRMEDINARLGLSDETRTLTKDERAHVQDFITAMRRDYGLEARVQVAQGVLSPPAADGKTLYVGLSLESKTAVVQLPPLVARALGPDFAKELETEHFPFHFGPGRDWHQGLLLALDLIRNRLAAINAEPAAAAGNTTDTKDGK